MYMPLALISFTRLQASGRPDLVTKVLLVQIPPYLLLLYVGGTQFGLAGCAMAAAIRNVADFVLLSCTVGVQRRGLGRIGLGFALMLVSVWLAGLWDIADWQWWIAALGCGAASLLYGAYTVPAEISAALVKSVKSAVGRA